MSIERLHCGPRMSQVVIHDKTVYLAGQVAAARGRQERRRANPGNPDDHRCVAGGGENGQEQAPLGHHLAHGHGDLRGDERRLGAMDRAGCGSCAGDGPLRPSWRLPSYKIEIAVIAAQPERAERSHLRRPQRSNLVDRMIDEVVRSTPSSAPIRSMTWSISATDAVTATAIRSTSPLTECSTRTCVDGPQRGSDGARFLRSHLDHDVRAHRAQVMFGRKAHAITDDHALLLEALDAALHAGPRPPHQPGQLRGRCPGVLAQRENQLLVDGIHGISPVLPCNIAEYTLITSKSTLPIVRVTMDKNTLLSPGG